MNIFLQKLEFCLDIVEIYNYNTNIEILSKQGVKSMSREHIARKLKELRQKNGLTADEVGAKIGKSGKTVNAWENNRGQPDAEILIELCDIYNVDNILKEFREQKTEIISLSNHEKKIVTAYRQKPEMQPAVDRLLGIDETELIPSLVAARSKNNDEPIHMELLPDLSKFPKNDTDL